MKCSKCGYSGDLSEWKYIGIANLSGTASFRTCPGCGHPEYFIEQSINEDYKGPEPWGLSKFRGKVFKGKKRRANQ